jgi:PAS domain S-box-containing protein
METDALEEVYKGKVEAPLRLLILEHSEHDIELILSELRTFGLAVDPVCVDSPEQFREALHSVYFDAVLAAYSLPNWNGLEALREVQAADKGIPFLLVTGAIGEEAAVETIKQGVSDYVLKDRLSRLPVALERALREKKLRDEAQRTHEALAKSEATAREQFAELEHIYRTAPIGLALYGPDLRYLRVNDELARINGVPAGKHPGLMPRDINPELGKTVESYIRRAFAKGESIQNVEIHGVTQAQPGVERDWLVSFHPLRGQDGVIFAVSGVVMEITEGRRTGEALRLSEARHRDLIEHSVYGIFRMSTEGEFLDANPALVSILGCSSREDLRALNLVRDVFRYPEQFAQFIAACRQQGQIHGAESEWRRRDGGMVSVRLHLRWLSAFDQPASVEVVAEDVTEVRAMERQLRQAQKFEAIGQLAGGVAHDFNNVVGAILGWAELGLEQSRSMPQIAERFARIREQADRAAALTRELLAFARRQVLQPRTVDLNTITSTLVSFLDKVIGKDIELKVLTVQLDPIKADATQIEQVLMNLCLNARDAMPKGGRLLVETEMVELDDSYCRFYPYVTPGRYAVLSVSDTGVGMDVETRERIFEPFFTTKAHGKGSGMGLATVYGIVKQHGGFIHVYSELGQGSLFRVYLPVCAAAASEGAPPQAPAPSLAEMRGTETILLAEDHESIREMARQALLSLGYRVLSAADGEEALRLCETERPALAVLDVVMPKLGGLAASERIAARFDNLPILFTSGYSQDSEGLAAARPSARYLQKPYSPTSLGRIVREILNQAQTQPISS